MKIVLDTNVVVSGFLNPHQAPGLILQRVAAGELALLYDARILAEYREVLLRPKFEFSADAVESFLRQAEVDGSPMVSRPLSERLPDPDDEPFLEVALSGKADFLVTGNAKHFPREKCQGVRVLAPSEFLEILRKSL